MNKWTLVGTLGGVAHTGTKAECEMIRSAMTKYGISQHKLEILPVEGPTLSDEVRQLILNQLIDNDIEVNSDCASWWDMMYYGCTGYKDFTDEELVEQYETFADPDEALLREAKAQLAIEEVLADDHEEKMEECYKIAEEEGF